MSFLFQNDASSNNPSAPVSRSAARACAHIMAATAGVSVLALSAQAQDVPEGARRLFLDVRSGLEWSDNPDLVADGDSRLVNRTRLDLTLERRTAIDTLTFGVGGDFVLGEDTDETLENVDARLRWGRDVGRSRIGLGLTFDDVELDSTDFATGVSADSVDFDTFDGGSRRTFGLVLDGAVGVDSPLGATYRLSQNRIRYEGTADPTLLDADETDLDFSITGALDRTTTLGLIGSYSEFDEDGPGELDSRSVRIGAELRSDITRTLTGRFALGHQETDQTGTSTTSFDGIFVEGDLTWDLPNGTAGLTLDSPIDVNGRRTTVRAERSMDLPRGGLSYSLGLSRAEGLSTQPLFGLTWSYEMPRATFEADLSQTPTTSRENVESINSVLSLNYIQQLTATSSLDVLFSVRDADEEGVGASDTRRIGLDLTYRRSLAQDWNLIGQVSSVRIEEDDGPDRTANTLFIGLEKRFGWN